jgi:hypothetical protein
MQLTWVESCQYAAVAEPVATWIAMAVPVPLAVLGGRLQQVKASALFAMQANTPKKSKRPASHVHLASLRPCRAVAPATLASLAVQVMHLEAPCAQIAHQAKLRLLEDTHSVVIVELAKSQNWKVPRSAWPVALVKLLSCME